MSTGDVTNIVLKLEVEFYVMDTQSDTPSIHTSAVILHISTLSGPELTE